MPDFNASIPPATVTNPGGAVSPFPAHVYKASADVPGALIVAWRGNTPVYNEFLVVADADAQADALKRGYSLTPVLGEKPAKAAKDKA